MCVFLIDVQSSHKAGFCFVIKEYGVKMNVRINHLKCFIIKNEGV